MYSHYAKTRGCFKIKLAQEAWDFIYFPMTCLFLSRLPGGANLWCFVSLMSPQCRYVLLPVCGALTIIRSWLLKQGCDHHILYFIMPVNHARTARTYNIRQEFRDMHQNESRSKFAKIIKHVRPPYSKLIISVDLK